MPKSLSAFQAKIEANREDLFWDKNIVKNMASNESTITTSDIIYQCLDGRERSPKGTIVKILLIMRTVKELEIQQRNATTGSQQPE